ncbi:HNH endonuclease [hydrothermal vent metagenome]|uniref:HNH endonuclease n=1 Tax=hydrothermal vent metagenome TaxID=652676 RepID=A0A1W1CBG8_9ZZZZ
MVFVLSRDKTPLAPTHEAKARKLLKQGKAVVHKIFPFTIRLKEKKESDKQFDIKFDVGASVTGVAIVDAVKCFFFAEIVHRGKVIKKAMDSRRAIRRGRRARKTRYREARFDNRTRPNGWLPPSVKSRADNVINFAKKYVKLIPLKKAIVEKVSFDTSSMTNGKKLYGDEYQNGELKDTKLRDFIFKKYNYKCVYCGGVGEEIEHIIPRSKGGTNSIQNLTLSCRKCNIEKGNLSLKDFGKKVKKDFSHIEPRKTPKNASIIQSARTYTLKELAKNFEVETGEGWETYANRKELKLPKEHYYDAMCIGDNYKYKIVTQRVLEVKAQGRGNRQMCRMDKFGFPRTKAKGSKIIKGFQTGDIVKAVVTKGKKIGTYLGKVAVRASGNFNITTTEATIQGINYRYCTTIQKGDGYAYATRTINQ